MPVRIVLSQGQSSDKTIAPTLIEGLKPDRDLVADRGYDARAIIDLVEARGGRAHIPTSRDRKVQRSVDHLIYRQRNLIERFFNKLKHFPPHRNALQQNRPKFPGSRPDGCYPSMDKV